MAAHHLCFPVPAADSVQHAPAHFQDALQRGRLGEQDLATLPGTFSHAQWSSQVALETVLSTSISTAI